MARSATRRIQKIQQYSLEDLPPNPLIAMRGPQRQSDMAEYLGVNKSVVASAEEGMFQLIPSSYRKKIVDIKQVNKEYQLHRKAKRRHNFSPGDFPPGPAKSKPMKRLLEHFDLTPWGFGAKACVHHIDIWKMQQDATQCTQNFLEFLEQVELLKLHPNWVKEFDKALRSDNPPRLTTT